MTTQDLAGRTAIVTGASRGIGLAIAQAIANAGGNVVVTSRTQESADAAAAHVDGAALGIAAHVVDEAAPPRGSPPYGPVLGQNHAKFVKTFDVNLWAPILWTSLTATAWMYRHGGVVVNTA